MTFYLLEAASRQQTCTSLALGCLCKQNTALAFGLVCSYIDCLCSALTLLELQAGGRLALVELPALVGCDLLHCERQAAVVVAEAQGRVLEAQGELITVQVLLWEGVAVRRKRECAAGLWLVYRRCVMCLLKKWCSA